MFELQCQELAIELERLERADLAAKSFAKCISPSRDAPRISGLAVFDMNKITACITLLATEVGGLVRPIGS